MTALRGSKTAPDGLRITVGQVLLLVLLAAIGFMVLGAHLWHKVVGTPSERGQALEAKFAAMKRANYLGDVTLTVAGNCRLRSRDAKGQLRPKS